jgi:hypothetical protein
VEHLEVFIEVEVSAILCFRLDLCSGILVLLGGRCHDTSLLVVGNALLEEVGLSCQGDVLHEVKWVGRLVVLLVTEGEQQPVGDELNVLLHQVGVHAEQRTGKCLSQELLLDADSLGNDVLDGLLAWAVSEMGEEEAGEVSVETLVTGNELVGEGQASHEATLLEPENGGEGTGEEDTLNGSEGNETLSESGILILDPPNCPVGLLLDARNGLDGIEEICALSLLLDVCVNEEGVCLGVNVLDHDLETVEAAGFWDLDLAAEALEEILVDNSVRRGEESENVGDEVALVVIEAVVPVVKVLGEINLLCCPERRFRLLVHLPDLL